MLLYFDTGGTATKHTAVLYAPTCFIAADLFGCAIVLFDSLHGHYVVLHISPGSNNPAQDSCHLHNMTDTFVNLNQAAEGLSCYPDSVSTNTINHHLLVL